MRAGRLIGRAILALVVLLAAGATAHAGSLWWTNIVAATHSIGKSGLDGSSPVSPFILTSGDPYGLYVASDYVYWTNYNAGTIARSALDGSKRTDAFISGASGPADVFVDDGFIYWANSGSNSIGRARRDGTGVDQSFITGTRSSATVWADADYVYWGNGSFSGASSIGRANIDGTGVSQNWLVHPGVRSPATVVTDERFLYWTNSGGAATIGRARLDGTGVNGAFIQAGPAGSLPNGLDLSGQFIYWSLFSTNEIGRAQLDGSPVVLPLVAAPSSRTQGPGSMSVSQYLLQVIRTGQGTVTSLPPGIACGTDCEDEYADATTVTLTATPADQSQFAGWSGPCSGLGKCVVIVNAPITARAAFSPLPPSSPVLTVSTTGPGVVTSQPGGIACGADCRQSFAPGTTVTLTATPSEGAAFTGWQGACAGTGPCTVPMSQSRAVSATFAAITGSPVLSVSLQGTGHGVVTSQPAGIACGANCQQTYPTGTALMLTADPSPGSVFSRWGGTCAGGATTCAVPMSAARSVTATFVPDNRFTIRTPRSTPRAFQESVRVPGPGRITVVARRTARGMKGTACSVRRSARRATTLRVSCTLTARTRALRTQARVRVSVKTTYTPTGGSARAITQKRVLSRTR